MLVLVADEGHVEELVTEVPEAAWDLMEHANRPPLSTLLGKASPPHLLGSNGSLAIRCIRDAYSAYVIRGLGRPIASTSANLTGGPTPKSFRDIARPLRSGVNHVSMHRQQKPLVTESPP